MIFHSNIFKYGTPPLDFLFNFFFTIYRKNNLFISCIYLTNWYINNFLCFCIIFYSFIGKKGKKKMKLKEYTQKKLKTKKHKHFTLL